MKRNTRNTIVNCGECRLAELHKWGDNPTIAFCEGNPERRNVASTKFICLMFENIRHGDKKTIIKHKPGERI